MAILADSKQSLQPYGSPLSFKKGASFCKLNFFSAFVFLRFHKAEEVHRITFIPSDSHSGFYFPPSSMVPLSLQRGKYVISFYFPLFKQSGINYPPTSSVPLSFKKGASFLMLSFNQLSHACPLQEENIPLHSCNLQGLHHPEPRMA